MKKKMDILDKAEITMKEAIKKVISEHKRDKRPLVI